jgi:hypothetical protein
MSTKPNSQDLKEKLIIYLKLLNFSNAHHATSIAIH